MISKYAPGQHRHRLSTQNLLQLSKTLSTLHAIPIQQKYLLPTTKQIHIQNVDYDPVLCHHDLNPKNIILDKEKVTLIDWEYAGINDRYFDLASAIVEFDLNDRQSNLFLKTYFANRSEANRDKLLAYQTYYQEVCEQWWQDKEKWSR